PDHAVKQHQRRQFATGQHVIADTDLLDISPLDDPLVDPFVTAATEHYSITTSKAPRIRLGEPPSPRGQVDHRPVIRDGGYRCINDVSPQHHPSAAAGRRVVHRFAPILREVTDVRDVQSPKTVLQSSTGQRLAEWTRKHRWKQREDRGPPG